MTKVKNLNGTTNNTPPRGYTTWKEWWEYKKSRKFSTCSRESCPQNATVGAHVQKVYGGNEWYIVPLCRSCNNQSSTVQFEVRDADLQAVNS